MQAWNLIELNTYMLNKSDIKDITEKEKKCSLEIKPAAPLFVPHCHYGNNIISECALSLSARLD